ncbi:MAG: DJ-1/PfpI family protein [archaeon]
MVKKILMVIAPINYRDEEFEEPKKVFKKKGYEVFVASKGVEQAKGVLGGIAEVDLEISEVQATNFDAIVFIGGAGASVYLEDKIAWSIARNAVSNGKILGAICIAPSILANAGVLNGKNATVWPSQQAHLETNGAKYSDNDVVVDGKIVTANGPKSAEKFGKKIVNLLE